MQKTDAFRSFSHQILSNSNGQKISKSFKDVLQGIEILAKWRKKHIPIAWVT